MRGRIWAWALLATITAGDVRAQEATPAAATAPAEATPTAATAPAEARPLYYDREITPADLEGRSLRELSIMRNTIFARVGNTFRRAWLRTYFTAQPWYHAKPKADTAKLTKVDHTNARIIGTKEAGFTTAELQAMTTALKERQKTAGSVSAEDAIELGLLSQRLGKWQGDGAVAAETRNPLEDPSLLDKLLTIEQLTDMSRRDLRILRNTIYARHGYTFKSALLRQYFEGTDWYKADPEYSVKRLTSTDQRNVKMVKSVEDTLGGPLTDHEHKTEDGWFVVA